MNLDELRKLFDKHQESVRELIATLPHNDAIQGMAMNEDQGVPYCEIVYRDTVDVDLASLPNVTSDGLAIRYDQRGPAHLL